MITIKKTQDGDFKFRLCCDRCNTVISEVTRPIDKLNNTIDDLMSNGVIKDDYNMYCTVCKGKSETELYPSSLLPITSYLQEMDYKYDYIEDMATIKIIIRYPLIEAEEAVIKNLLSLEVNISDREFKDNIIKYVKI